MPRVTVTKLIRLEGRGQNQPNKPRLIMATLDYPDISCGNKMRELLASASTCK